MLRVTALHRIVFIAGISCVRSSVQGRPGLSESNLRRNRISGLLRFG